MKFGSHILLRILTKIKKENLQKVPPLESYGIKRAPKVER